MRADVFALYVTDGTAKCDSYWLVLWQMLWPLCDWLMLLPWWQMELATVGMCQCIKADVITLLADVKAIGSLFPFYICGVN